MQLVGLAPGRWSDSRVFSALVGGVAAVAIAASAWIYGGHLTYNHGPPIRADGAGYYVYLPAVFLDHDLTLRRTATRSFGGGPRYIPGVYLVKTASGKREPLDQYAVGEAVLIAPFFAAGTALAVIAHEPRDGFSWPYQAADATSGLVYVLLGLFLTATVLRRLFSRRTVVITTLALAFGAALVEYATYDVSFSHGYSFCLIALVLRLTLSVWEKPGRLNALALGASVGLVGLVRLTNLDILVFCALVGVQRRADIDARMRTFGRHRGLLALGAAACVLVLLPQFAYWYRITGHVLVNEYRASGAYLNVFHPHLIGVLFSVRKGLFFWTPLLLLAVAGLPFLRRTTPPIAVAAVLYLAVTTWIVSSWSIWWYGGSFGMRALIDAMPVFALGLAALVETARGAAARRAVMLGVTVTSLMAVHGMIAYWLKAIPYDGTTFHQYLESYRTW
jgi:hypothetical protein